MEPKEKYANIKSKNKRDLEFPPVTDYNPIFAAQFLTIEDSLFYYDLLREFFEALWKGKSARFLVLSEFIKDSRKAYEWLVFFYKELERILEIEDIKDVPKFEGGDEEIIFTLPSYLRKKVSSDYYGFYPKKFKLNNNDVVNRYRVVYIGKSLELTDFRDGFPAWYMLNDTTVFEDYNVKSNKRIRIDFRRGEFLYFVAGASDNWQQIVDIPLEIDYVVAALMFRN